MPTSAAGQWIGLIDGHVEAFDQESGARRWRTQIKPAGAAARNIRHERDYVVVAETNGVVAVSATGGALLRRFEPPTSPARCEITTDNDAVYVGTRSHIVYALELTTGVPRWQVDIGSTWQFLGVVTGVALAADTLYVAAEEWLTANGVRRRGHIVALDRRNGDELWRYAAASDSSTVSSAPRVVGGLLLAPDLMTGFFAVDRFTGQEVWRVFTSAIAFGVRHAPVERNGIVYAASQGGIYAVNLETGVLRWAREDLVGGEDAALCGQALLTQNNSIQVLDPESGESLGSLLKEPPDFPTSDIAVDGSRAFVLTNVAAHGIRCPS